MQTADMIRMANQIAGFFKNYGAEEGKKEVATHINNFWEPRMRQQFFNYVGQGGTGFDPLVLAAADLVRKPHEHTQDHDEAIDPKTQLPKEATEA